MKEKILEFLSGLKEGQKIFGKNIATIINSILLSIVYFIGVGLTSIFAKLFKKRFLDLEMNTGTYWEDLNLSKEDITKYYRQF
ncbi:MAG: hypothetical protein AABX54_05920 [Nanoarchaeota archaeon]